MPPAPGQGALAVQARRDDAAVLAVLRELDDPRVRRAVVAERALLRAVGGGCRAPTGALATPDGDAGFVFLAGTAIPTGEARHVVSLRVAGDRAELLADVALRAARELMRAVPQPQRALLDPRPDPDEAFAAALYARGVRVVNAATFGTQPVTRSAELDRARASLDGYDWVVLTSRRGVTALLDDNRAPAAGVRWAAVGPATAAAIRSHRLTISAMPHNAGSRGIPDAMSERGSLQGARVLLARADAADTWLPQRLRDLGAVVDDVVAYRTEEGPEHLLPALRDALDDPDLDAVAFASGSAVRGLVALAGEQIARARRLHAFTAGPQTSAVAREHGFAIAAESPATDGQSIAETIAEWYERGVTTWVQAQLRCA